MPGDGVADGEREDEAGERQEAERDGVAEEDEGEQRQHGDGKGRDRACQDDARPTASEGALAAERADREPTHGEERDAGERKVEGVVQHQEPGVPAVEHPDFRQAGNEPRRVDHDQRPTALLDRRARLGKGQAEVEDGSGGERAQDERQPVEAAGGEQVDVEDEVESPDDAEGEQRAALPRVGLQVKDREADRQEGEPVQHVDAEGGAVVPRREGHGGDATFLAPARPLEDVAVHRARRRRPHDVVERAARGDRLAVDAHHVRPERHLRSEAGPLRAAEGDHHEVVPHDEARERAAYVGQRADDGGRRHEEAAQ